MNRLSLIAYANALIGTPYRWGGANTIDGFDCSGLILELLWSQSLWPSGRDSTAAEIYHAFVRAGTYVEYSPAKKTLWDPGTLAFYGENVKKISHIAMVIDWAGTIIEAGGGNSKTVDLTTAAAQNAFVRLRQITHRTDLLATLTIDRPPAL